MKGLIRELSQDRILRPDFRVIFSEKMSISHNPYNAHSASDMLTFARHRWYDLLVFNSSFGPFEVTCPDR